MRRIIVLLICATVISMLSGCGKISNDNLTIKQYKGLEIEQVENENALEDVVWEALIANCEVKVYPKDKLEKYTEDLKGQYSAAAAMYGTTEEQLIEADYGISMQEVAQERVCKELAVELIADKEELVVTDQEYLEGLKRYAEEYGYQDREAFESFVGEENLRKALLQEEVTEFLVKNCQYKK